MTDIPLKQEVCRRNNVDIWSVLYEKNKIEGGANGCHKWAAAGGTKRAPFNCAASEGLHTHSQFVTISVKSQNYISRNLVEIGPTMLSLCLLPVSVHLYRITPRPSPHLAANGALICFDPNLQ